MNNLDCVYTNITGAYHEADEILPPQEPSLRFRTVLSTMNGTCLGKLQPIALYMVLVTGYISKGIDDVTVSITRPNQKPWMTAEVHALLRTRDTAFWSDDKAALRTARGHQSGKACTCSESPHPLPTHWGHKTQVAGHPGQHQLQDISTCLRRWGLPSRCAETLLLPV